MPDPSEIRTARIDGLLVGLTIGILLGAAIAIGTLAVVA